MTDIAFIELTGASKKSRVSIAISDINAIFEVDGKFRTSTVITLKHRLESLEVEETYDEVKDLINKALLKD